MKKSTRTIVQILLFVAVVLATVQVGQAQMLSMQRGDAGAPFSDVVKDEYKKSDRKYIGVSTGFDVMNAFVGGHKNEAGERRNEKAYDGIHRVFYGRGSTEVGLFTEQFDEIGYQAYGLDFNYVANIWKKVGLVWIVGAEARLIHRDAGILFPTDGSSSYSSNTKTIGLNNRLRFENVFGTGLGVEWHTNNHLRADVRDLAENNRQTEDIPAFMDSFSNYFTVTYYF